MDQMTFKMNEPRAPDLDSKDNVSHEVYLSEIEFTRNAKITLGKAVQEVAVYCNVPVGEITKRMRGKMYWLEPSGKLMIVFPVPAANADMFVEIPAEHWDFKEGCKRTQ